VAKSYSKLTIPADTTITLAPYGSSYFTYFRPEGVLKLRYTHTSFTKGAVMAIIYRGSDITVTELQRNVQYTIGEDGIADKVILVYVNLTGVENKITMASQVAVPVAGVEDEQGGASGLALLGNVPNPVTDATLLRFTTTASAPVSLALYDAEGRVIRTVIDNERYESGQHALPFNTDGIPGGWYLLRLRQDGIEVTRPMTIIR
jgi:hypothetical protein